MENCHFYEAVSRIQFLFSFENTRKKEARWSWHKLWRISSEEKKPDARPNGQGFLERAEKASIKKIINFCYNCDRYSSVSITRTMMALSTTKNYHTMYKTEASRLLDRAIHFYVGFYPATSLNYFLCHLHI